MTEQEKLDVYLRETLRIDVTDPINFTRVADVTAAWMVRAAEPPVLLDDNWKGVVAHTLQRMKLAMVDSPLQATSLIDGAIDTAVDAINQANHVVQASATHLTVIKNQGHILDAFAMLLQAPSGSAYMDLIPKLQALVGQLPQDTGELMQ